MRTPELLQRVTIEGAHKEPGVRLPYGHLVEGLGDALRMTVNLIPSSHLLIAILDHQ